MSDQDQTQDLLALTADIVAEYVATNSVSTGDIGGLIGSVYQALSGLDAPQAPVKSERPQGMVTARKSLSTPSHIISMIDGKSYKMLKRHLGMHGYTPESYREAFGLPRDYPMVAPEYGEQRSQLAKKIGLGRKPKVIVPAKAATSTKAAAPAKATAPAKIAEPAKASPKPRRQLKALFGDAIAAAKHHLGGE
jgi:predicted transcriptional regulator